MSNIAEEVGVFDQKKKKKMPRSGQQRSQMKVEVSTLYYINNFVHIEISKSYNCRLVV